MTSGFFDIYKCHSQQPLFGQLHPALRALLALTPLLITLGCFSVVMLAMSLLLALGFIGFVRGPAACLRTLRQAAPLLIVIMVLNPLISPSGTHALLTLGPFAIYGESLMWGILMGLMFAASLAWLEGFGLILPADGLCDLLGSTTPTLALMVSMAMRLVPDLFVQAQGAKAVREACTASRPPNAQNAPGSTLVEKPVPPKVVRPRLISAKLSWAACISTALLGWTLAESLSRASSMEARGWGVGPRSHYRQWRWTLSQKVQFAMLLMADGFMLSSFFYYQAGWASALAPQALLGGTLPGPVNLLSLVLLGMPLAVFGYLTFQERRMP